MVSSRLKESDSRSSVVGSRLIIERSCHMEKDINKKDTDKKHIIIRDMSFQDIKEISEIEKESFSTPWSEKSFEDSLKLSYAYFLVAQIGDIPVGYAGMYKLADEGDITNIAVKPEFRRKGIAHKLLAGLEEISKKTGIRVINLEVRESNHNAIRLYERNGFENIGKRKNFYEKPTENAIIMIKKID